MSKAEKILYMTMYVLFTFGVVLAIARNDYSDAIWILIGGMWMHNSARMRLELEEFKRELENK
jgi:hypothetical protein